MSCTRIAMEWDEHGAVVSSNLQILCPRCHAGITPGLEHRCGNRMLRAVKPAPAKRVKAV